MTFFGVDRDPDPGSMLLTNDPDLAIFIIDLQDANTNLKKKSWVFLPYLLNDKRIRSWIWIHTSE